MKKIKSDFYRFFKRNIVFVLSFFIIIFSIFLIGYVIYNGHYKIEIMVSTVAVLVSLAAPLNSAVESLKNRPNIDVIDNYFVFSEDESDFSNPNEPNCIYSNLMVSSILLNKGNESDRLIESKILLKDGTEVNIFNNDFNKYQKIRLINSNDIMKIDVVNENNKKFYVFNEIDGFSRKTIIPTNQSSLFKQAFSDDHYFDVQTEKSIEQLNDLVNDNVEYIYFKFAKFGEVYTKKIYTLSSNHIRLVR